MFRVIKLMSNISYNGRIEIAFSKHNVFQFDTLYNKNSVYTNENYTIFIIKLFRCN